MMRRPFETTAPALLAAALAGLLSACTGGGGGDAVDWLRQPLEVGWVGVDPPALVFTVSADSREDHQTVLYVADADQPIGFDQAAEADANGNPPAIPATQLTTAYWLWAPTGLVVGDHTHVFSIAEDAGGARQLRRVVWADDPADATAGAVSGSNGVVAYAAVPCDADVCVLTARVGAGGDGPTELVLTRHDESGGRVGEATTIARVDGVARSVHAVLEPGAEGEPAAALHALAVTCEGCAGIDFDDYEASLYDVTSRVVHVRAPLGDEADEADDPAVLFEWGALVDAASAVPSEDGLDLLYWRAAATDAPGCTGQGHCPVERALVRGTWRRADGTFVEADPIATTELGHLQTLVRSADRLWALWREADAAEPFLRELRLAEVAADAPVRPIARTWTPLLLRAALSESPAAVPFDYVDGLAAAGTADEGPWVALRYRTLAPGGAEVCGDDVRVGVWTAQLTTDGLVATSNDDPEALWAEADCGEGTCAGSVTGPRRSATPLALALLAAFALAAALRRRRGRSRG